MVGQTIQLFNEVLLKCDVELPNSFYKAKKTILDFGLDYKKIDACVNDCMLYWKGHCVRDKIWNDQLCEKFTIIPLTILERNLKSLYTQGHKDKNIYISFPFPLQTKRRNYRFFFSLLYPSTPEIILFSLSLFMLLPSLRLNQTKC